MLVHNDRIALGGVRGDKFIFGAIRGDKQLFDTSVITDANKEYILATYGEEALAKALVYLHGNPSFIPFFNEDPDTICSVCEIGWFRGITTAPIHLTIVPTRRTTYDFMAMVKSRGNSGNTTFFLGQGSNSEFASDFGIQYNDYANFLRVNNKEINDRYTHPQGGVPYRYEFDIKHLTITKQDTKEIITYDTKIADDYVVPNKVIAWNGIPTTNYSASATTMYFIAKEDGKKLIHLIPFKRGANYYLLDLLKYKLYDDGLNTNKAEETIMKL